MIPNRIKNEALTDVPIIPPIVLKPPNRLDTPAAVAATTMDVMMTILNIVRFSRGCTFEVVRAYVECPREKKVPTVTAFCPLASNRRVIKSIACSIRILAGRGRLESNGPDDETYGDMICIESMTQTQRIGDCGR